jgi:phosphoribosylanthranilate isomerase
VRIKICGITNVEDANLAAALGADALGLNFYARSPRVIDRTRAEMILRALPPFVEPVGLFVNEPLQQVFATVNALGRIRCIQWHGDKRELCDPHPFQLISAFPVKDRADLVRISRFLNLCRDVAKLPTAILVDAAVAGQYGGTGQTAPWDLLAGFQPGVPLILAGGLTADNVAEAIRLVRPFAVDVASGVETAPGIKDPEKLRRFIGNARAAAAKWQ